MGFVVRPRLRLDRQEAGSRLVDMERKGKEAATAKACRACDEERRDQGRRHQL